jgi:hypothetical protein
VNPNSPTVPLSESARGTATIVPVPSGDLTTRRSVSPLAVALVIGRTAPAMSSAPVVRSGGPKSVSRPSDHSRSRLDADAPRLPARRVGHDLDDVAQASRLHAIEIGCGKLVVEIPARRQDAAESAVHRLEQLLLAAPRLHDDRAREAVAQDLVPADGGSP